MDGFPKSGHIYTSNFSARNACYIVSSLERAVCTLQMLQLMLNDINIITH